MAGELSTVGAQYALDYVTGRALPYTATRTTYLALWTAALSDTSTNATAGEVSAAGYARQAVTWTAATSANPSQTQNSGVVTFGPFTGLPGTITYCALVSSSSGTTGDFLMWWQLNTAKTPALNESLQFAAGALYMTLT
jgi:hypothetical protein